MEAIYRATYNEKLDTELDTELGTDEANALRTRLARQFDFSRSDTPDASPTTGADLQSASNIFIMIGYIEFK